MSDACYKYVFKYIIIGNPSVGKSCILSQFINEQFIEEYEVTVGIEFGAQTIDLEDYTKVKLQIWDTAGQENFKSITRTYYRSAAVAVIVYDITSRESFEAVNEWLEECRKNGETTLTLVLVGNKTDLLNERVITYEEGEQFAQNNNMLFFETSAKTADNVKRMFHEPAKIVHQKILNKEIDPANDSHGVKLGTAPMDMKDDTTNLNDGLQKQRKGCC